MSARTCTAARWSCLLPLCLLLGCARAPAEPVPSAGPLKEAGSRFDPAACGTLRGRVDWTGELPHVAPFVVLPAAPGTDFARPRQVWKNPNAPLIDEDYQGVGSAVVFLRGVDPLRGRPWNQPPVRVAMRDHRLDVQQGERCGHYGFVRRGESIEMVSRQAVLHSLHADGAAFFTLPFPDPEQPLTRRLNKKGVVELSSAATFFWMRAYLFVDDHPYYVCTAADGSFTLDAVPAGDYEVVCWMPNWREAGRDLDPELGIVLRLFHCPPVEVVQRVSVQAGETREVCFTLSEKRFRSGYAASGERK